VATRPRERNGIGLTPELAAAELAEIEGFFAVVGESTDVYAAWKDLIRKSGVSGVQAHDARLIAAMKVYGITKILTFDVKDFARYPDIEVLDPATVAASQV
jgi:predicted nucleic acid-binding protein